MTKILFEISEAGPDNTIDLEPTKPYMVARIVNYIKTYDEEGVETKTAHYYPLERCTEE